MKISSIFQKDIERNIKGVITVGGEGESEVQQELAEYVVTKELDRHFHDFASAFTKAVDGPTDKMGVWISGFFGSGKSHFLKMLSYLLENRTVNGKNALHYFDDKIDDKVLLGDLLRVVKASSIDVVIFNIDSKSASDSRSNKEAIVHVLCKVFNEMQGFSGEIGWLADLERQMVKDGTYEGFQQTYLELSGQTWPEGRDGFYYDQDNVIEALARSTRMSHDSAKEWFDKGEENYSLSIERFTRLVKDYCEAKGSAHKIVFLIDEVGQYIGENSDLMLNLQTVVEDLGKALKGRAWVIVTSQEAIDILTRDRIKGNDFSKIMGRFATRLNLSSANTDEVIKKRLLVKTDVGDQILQAIYGEKSAILKNMISFSADTAEMKSYSDVRQFVEVYPFIPYQFRLMQKVFEQIRRMGATGKHLSEGERSMLSAFQDAAKANGNREIGALVPLSAFYDSLAAFLDTSISRVIQQAAENERLRPEDLALLKMLFMIKSVKEVKPNVENLTTLSLTHFDQDKIALRKQINESLGRLCSETLVQKLGDEYYFLTNEEQDINKEIKNTDIDSRDVTDYIANIAFDDIYGESKFKFNPWRIFAFNKKVDAVFRGTQNNELTLWIITPEDDDYFMDRHGLALKTAGQDCVLLKLPEGAAYIEETKEVIKTEKYLRHKISKSNPESIHVILTVKQTELGKAAKRIRTALEEAISKAEIFVAGQYKELPEHAPKQRLESALSLLVEHVYGKLGYIEAPVQEATAIGTILRCDDVEQLSLDGWNVNQKALDEMDRYIQEQHQRNFKVNLRTLLSEFTRKPYGWSELDIAALAARLLVKGTIVARYNGDILDRKHHALAGYLTKTREADKLVLDIKLVTDKLTIDKVKKVMRELSGRADWASKEDVLYNAVREELTLQHEKLKQLRFRCQSKPYPAATVVNGGYEIFERLLKHHESNQLFQAIVAAENEILDFAEDIHTVNGFFENQATIWDGAKERLAFFVANEIYLSEPSLAALAKVREILASPSPYKQIKDLPSLLGTVDTDYGLKLEREKKKVRDILERQIGVVKEFLAEQGIEESKWEAILQTLTKVEGSLAEKKDCNQVVALTPYIQQAYEKCLEAAQQPSPKPAEGGGKPQPVKPALTKVRIDSLVKGPKTLKTEADLDQMLAEIRQKLKMVLDEGQEIRLF